MDYLSLFEIGSLGMSFSKKQVDAISLNIVNMNTASRVGESYRPVRAVLNYGKIGGLNFESYLLAGYDAIRFVEYDVEPKIVHEPSHPLANQDGFVEYPGINHATETVAMIKAMHTYNANVKTVEAAKALAEEALSIGS